MPIACRPCERSASPARPSSSPAASGSRVQPPQPPGTSPSLEAGLGLAHILLRSDLEHQLRHPSTESTSSPSHVSAGWVMSARGNVGMSCADQKGPKRQQCLVEILRENLSLQFDLASCVPGKVKTGVPRGGHAALQDVGPGPATALATLRQATMEFGAPL